MAILHQIFITITNSILAIRLHIYCTVRLRVTSGDVRKRSVIRRVFEIREKIADLS